MSSAGSAFVALRHANSQMPSLPWQELQSSQCSSQVFVERGRRRKRLRVDSRMCEDVAEAHVVLDEARICSVSSFEKRRRLRMTSADADADLDVAVEADAWRWWTRRCRAGRWRACRCRGAARPRRGWRGSRGRAFRAAAWCGPRRRPRDATRAAAQRRASRTASGRMSDEEASLVEELKGAAGVAFGEHAGELIADAFRADLRMPGASVAMARHGCGLDARSRGGRRSGRRAACGACLR